LVCGPHCSPLLLCNLKTKRQQVAALQRLRQDAKQIQKKITADAGAAAPSKQIKNKIVLRALKGARAEERFFLKAIA